MADPVVTVALETIRDLLFDEGKFLCGVRGQVEELRDELEVLESFLKDANARKHEDERVRICVRQAKRLAHRAEDIIEVYAIKVASQRGGGFGKVARRVACIVGEVIAIHKVGVEIGNINTGVANLIKRLEGYGVNRIVEAQESSATMEKQRRLRTTYAHEGEEYFVGMEDDVSKLVSWVTEDSKIRRVISICGIGGLGKTTIARKVFNHRQVQRSFECFTWVSVTQQCQIKMLLQDILIQILGDKGRDEVKDLGEEGLVRKLHDVLKNKKCFVVLDDMWKLDDWESLRPGFPSSEASSKIMLTTRISEVADVAHFQSRHTPTFLDEKDGWDLLTKIGLTPPHDRDNKLPETVELVGRDMLRKCGGLPLAISALGGILRSKDPLVEWETVNKKVGTYLRGNGGIVSVLALSYDDLPSYLKPCFLYMGCFKEDEEIDVMRLFQLWMAEGLISSSRKGMDETLMDVANDFLDELISRNMVQPQVRGVSTGKRFCRLHDLMRELCLTKGKEEEFLEVKSMSFGDEEARHALVDGIDLCRQAILVDNKVKCFISLQKSTSDEHLRALIFNQKNINTLTCPIKFKRLRSLILDGCIFKDKKLPKEIRDMIHLRYLSLGNCLDYGKLPSFIGDLKCLQTLNVDENKDLRLPNIFHKMKRLRYLYLPISRRHYWFAKKLKFHGLNELEVLEGFHSEYDQFNALSELSNLQRFSAVISSFEYLSTILDQLGSLRKVQYISIIFQLKYLQSQFDISIPAVRKLLLCRYLQRLVLWNPIGNFGRYEPQFWPNLVSLDLYHTQFEEDPMPFLGELPNLLELNIRIYAFIGKEMCCGSKAFPKLTSLEINNVFGIEKWRVDAGAFPNLSSLSIYYCSSFEIVPHGLTRITSLTRIEIISMPEEFKNKYGKLHNTNQ